MSIEALKNALPDYAKDLKLNLSNVAAEPALAEQPRWGALLAAAMASGNPEVTRAVEAEAGQRLAPEAMTAAKTAAAIMAMNNVYYRSLHLLSNPDYRSMPARLRMNALARPGVDKADFELWCLTVSAINGCGACLESHERELMAAGVGREAVQNALRIAAVVKAVAAVLTAEAALGGATEARAAA